MIESSLLAGPVTQNDYYQVIQKDKWIYFAFKIIFKQ